MKIERYEDTEEFRENARKKADRIIERILAQAYYLDCKVLYGVKIVVFMSPDLMADLTRGTADWVKLYHRTDEIVQVGGYEVKPIYGTDELYIGIKI